jgi:DNA-binding Lrp family transcriptional regulator
MVRVQAQSPDGDNTVRSCSFCRGRLYDLRMPELDDLDRRLIAALRTDGREPVTTLARRLGVTRATVNSRLDRLLASGTLLGFTARIREDSEPDAIRAISLIEVEGRATDAVIRALRGFPR